MMRCLPLVCCAVLCGPAAAQERSRVDIAITTFGTKVTAFAVSVGLGQEVTGGRRIDVGTGEVSVVSTGFRLQAAAGQAAGNVPDAGIDAGPLVDDPGRPEFSALTQSCILIDAYTCRK